MLLDATCAPADVAYPTDLNLLNEAREKLEEIIDTLHAPQIGRARKPRTYRDKARKEYLAVAKQRRANGKVIRRAIGKQLLVMNLERRLRDLFAFWLNRLLSYRIPGFGNIFVV